MSRVRTGAILPFRDDVCMASVLCLLPRRAPWTRPLARAFGSSVVRSQEVRAATHCLAVLTGSSAAENRPARLARRQRRQDGRVCGLLDAPAVRRRRSECVRPSLSSRAGPEQRQSRAITTSGRTLGCSTSVTWCSPCQSQYRAYCVLTWCSFTGLSALAFLEHLTPSSLSSLPEHGSTLSVLLNPQGGIIDDTIVTKHTDDRFYVVTNAGRRERDLAWFAEKLQAWNSEQGKDKAVSMEVLDGWGLVALQGPRYRASSGSNSRVYRPGSGKRAADARRRRPEQACLWPVRVHASQWRAGARCARRVHR